MESPAVQCGEPLSFPEAALVHCRAYVETQHLTMGARSRDLSCLSPVGVFDSLSYKFGQVKRYSSTRWSGRHGPRLETAWPKVHVAESVQKQAGAHADKTILPAAEPTLSPQEGEIPWVNGQLIQGQANHIHALLPSWMFSLPQTL